ncbi:MAG: ROK family protein [bacterium]
MDTGKTLIGVDIGGTFIKAGAVRNGRIIKNVSFPTPLSCAEALFGEVNRIIGILGSECVPVDAVGIGIPGTISPAGVIGHSPNLPIDGFKALDFFRKSQACPVAVDNDANMAAVGERLYGSARGCGNFVLLTLGTGVGSGIFIGGELFHGPGGFAGEIGHMVISETGPTCKCGNRGCLETLASGSAIIRTGREIIEKFPGSSLAEFCGNEEITAYKIFQAAEAGEGQARNIFAETGYHLGTGIHNLCNILNPELVVIGGGVAGAGKWFLPEIKKVLSNSSFESAHTLKVEISPLKNQAAILGAASYYL